MNKKGEFLSWLFGTIAILIILFVISLFVAVLYFSHTSTNMCDHECADRGTRFSKIIPNGEAFSLEDMCICYYEDRTERFVQGGEK